jgi:hypothetical protein
MLEALLLLVSLVLIGRLHIENAEALQQEQREARPVASAQPAQPVLG